MEKMLHQLMKEKASWESSLSSLRKIYNHLVDEINVSNIQIKHFQAKINLADDFDTESRLRKEIEELRRKLSDFNKNLSETNAKMLFANGNIRVVPK